MISKEWRDAHWKLAIGVLFFMYLMAVAPLPYEVILNETRNPPTAGPDGSPIPQEFLVPGNPVEYAMQDMGWIYGDVGAPILAALAAFLGVALISREMSQGTILLMLSKPVSRTRLLLEKYAVGAGTLLAAALLGSVGLAISVAVRGYPMSELSLVGIAFSTLLIWLGSLCVLSLALLFSVLLGSVLKSFIATAIAVYMVFAFPRDFLNYSLWVEYHRLGVSEKFVEGLSLRQYWTSESLYMGESLGLVSFLICMIAATVPLLAALWIFNRKAY